MNSNKHTGITIRSSTIILSKAFCTRYVKDNKFVSPKWDTEKGILELVFYPEDSDVSFRIPLTTTDGTTRMNCAKFLTQLRQFKMGRYKVFDIELDWSSNLVLKFKMKKND